MNTPQMNKIERGTNEFNNWVVSELKIPDGPDGETIDIAAYIASKKSKTKNKFIYLRNYTTVEHKDDLKQHVSNQLALQGTRVAVSSSQTKQENQRDIFFRLACIHYTLYRSNNKKDLKPKSTQTRRTEAVRPLSTDRRCKFSLLFCFDTENSMWYVKSGTGCICHTNHPPDIHHSSKDVPDTANKVVEEGCKVKEKYLVRDNGNAYKNNISLFKSICRIMDSDNEAYNFAQEGFSNILSGVQNVVASKKRKEKELAHSSSNKTDQRKSAKRLKPIGEK